MPQPPVVMWFKVYAVAMALLYIACSALGLAIIFFGHEWGEMPPGEAIFVGSIFAAVSVPLIFVFGAAPFLPRRPWVWIYDLVLICAGFTGCCTLPFSIVLLIFWIRPETKAYFGRT
ncbi:MAG TPA: hypothetical protein VHL59_14015 [Thermoanaerobaculia bacterium]|nr:hypothetical protein [Thermoanaerobaculia bacterium]